MNKSVNKVNNLSLSPSKLQAIELWRETRGHISNICKAIGISRTAYYKWIAEDASFAKAIADAESELNDDMREALIQKGADGSSTDIQFYLKKRHPDFKDQPPVLIQQNFSKHLDNELKEFE